MKAKMKMMTNVGKIETTGFGREDGGCLGVLLPELSTRETMRTFVRFSDLRPLQSVSRDLIICKSYYSRK